MATKGDWKSVTFTAEEEAEFKTSFDHFDADGNGVIDYRELLDGVNDGEPASRAVKPFASPVRVVNLAYKLSRSAKPAADQERRCVWVAGCGLRAASRGGEHAVNTVCVGRVCVSECV